MCVFWCRQNGGIYNYSVCYVINQNHPYIRRLQEWFDCFFFEERRKSCMAKQINNNFPNTTSACLESTAVFSPFFGILTCDDTQKENMVSTPKRKKWANLWGDHRTTKDVKWTMKAHFLLGWEHIALNEIYQILCSGRQNTYICLHMWEWLLPN